jgi:hypothetical protein
VYFSCLCDYALDLLAFVWSAIYIEAQMLTFHFLVCLLGVLQHAIILVCPLMVAQAEKGMYNSSVVKYNHFLVTHRIFRSG